MKSKLRLKDKFFIALAIFSVIFLGVIKLIDKLVYNEELNALVYEKKLVFQDKGVEIKIKVANDNQSRYEGLSDVKHLEWDEGFLFEFESADTHAFVMRDMKFDLDFIFIYEEKVVDIARNVSHLYEGRVVGATPYDKVLEVNAEWVRKNNIKIGDEIKIK